MHARQLRECFNRLADYIQGIRTLLVLRSLSELGPEIFPCDQQTPEALGVFQKAETEKWWPDHLGRGHEIGVTPFAPAGDRYGSEDQTARAVGLVRHRSGVVHKVADGCVLS